MSEKRKKKQVEEKSIANTEMVESPATEAEQTLSNASEKPTELVKVDIEKQKRLTELKKRIHRLTDNFIQVVIDLKEIKDGELWQQEFDKSGKPLYTTFESFMDAEFGFKRAYYSRLNKAAHAYNWLGEHDKELQEQIKVVRPAFYEALDQLPDEDKIETLKALLEDKSKKQKGASLISIWKKSHKGQKLSGEPKEKDVKKQIEIALGILSRISPDKLKENDVLLDSLVKDNKELKEVIKYINGRIAKSK